MVVGLSAGRVLPPGRDCGTATRFTVATWVRRGAATSHLSVSLSRPIGLADRRNARTSIKLHTTACCGSSRDSPGRPVDMLEAPLSRRRYMSHMSPKVPETQASGSFAMCDWS